MILLGLGSNIGDREKNIVSAIQKINKHAEIFVDCASSLYETEPVGFQEQPVFLNAVISVETQLNPFQLLEVCLAIEAEMGRIRDKRWGPRVIDIDLLIYWDQCIQENTLQLPHPFLHERRFVLVPLNEITKERPIVNGFTAKDLLEKTKDYSSVTWYGSINLGFIGSR